MLAVSFRTYYCISSTCLLPLSFSTMIGEVTVLQLLLLSDVGNEGCVPEHFRFESTFSLSAGVSSMSS